MVARSRSLMMKSLHLKLSSGFLAYVQNMNIEIVQKLENYSTLIKVSAILIHLFPHSCFPCIHKKEQQVARASITQTSCCSF